MARSYKKIASLLAVSSLAVAGLSACGGGNSEPSAAPEAGEDLETTIKILAPSYADSTKADWEAIIAEFNKTYPNVTVELQVEGWDDFTSKVQARIQAQDMPDILNDNQFALSAESGILYPIDEVISADVLKTIDPALLENGKGLDGTQWAAPDVASARNLTYNVDILEQAGVDVPKTWADMEAACTAIKAKFPDVYPYGMPLGQEEAQIEATLWVWGAGGDWKDGDKLSTQTPEVAEGFDQMKKLIDMGCTQPNVGSSNRADVVDLFNNGKVAMYNGHSGLFSDTPDTIKYDAAPIPSKDGEPVAVGVTDFIVAFDNGDEDRKAATAAFLDLFYSDAMYTSWYKASGLLPVTTSVIESESAAADELGKKYYDALPTVRFTPVGTSQWDVLQAALQGGAGKIAESDSKTVLADIQAQVDAQS